MCLAVATTLRMSVLGIDYLSDDISQFRPERPGCFIEVNAMPQMNLKRADSLFDALFPAKYITKFNEFAVVLVDKKRINELKDVEPIKESLNDRKLKTIACPIDSVLYQHREAILPNIQVVPYHHPNEILLNANIDQAVFLLDLYTFQIWGLPFEAPAFLFTLLSSRARNHRTTENFLESLTRTQIIHY